nr:MAG TPA: hypothetical protein [Caudoviricetes sp.]
MQWITASVWDISNPNADPGGAIFIFTPITVENGRLPSRTKSQIQKGY